MNCNTTHYRANSSSVPGDPTAPFEIFDAIGAFRTLDGNVAVDSQGELVGTKEQDGPVNHPVALMGRLVKAPEVSACFARQWLRFALGREEGEGDEPSVERVQQAFALSGGRIPALLEAIIESDAFRLQKVTR